MFSAAALSATEYRFAREGVLHDCRADGRQRLDLRPIAVRRGTAAYSVGSATATIGGSTDIGARGGESTVVAAAVSCDVTESPDGCGSIRFDVDIQHVGLLDAVAGGDGIGARSRRQQAEAALERALSRCYGVPVDAEASAAEEAAMHPAPKAAPAPTPAELLAGVRGRALAQHRQNVGVDLKALSIGQGHAFELRVDVQVRTASAGGVLAAALAAVRGAIADALLPTATVSVGTDGSAAVHLNNKERTKRVPADRCPLAACVAVDPAMGTYVVDPSPAEEAALPFTGYVAVAPTSRGSHHTVAVASLLSSRDASDAGEVAPAVDGLAAGMRLQDARALLGEASGALADAVFNAVTEGADSEAEAAA